MIVGRWDFIGLFPVRERRPQLDGVLPSACLRIAPGINRG
jgi:hypothetical protein